MTNYTRELMYGIKPIHRDNPQAGESEWYYYDPRETDNFSDMKKIDVPSENSPNPYANEIQNYLYESDRYNYNQLYGNIPPPATQPTQTSFTGTSGYINSQSQPTGWRKLSNSDSGFGSSTVGQHIANAVNQPNGYFQNSNTGNINNNLQSNTSVWDNAKDFAQNAVNTIAPYTPTYPLGYGIGTVQNMLPQIRNNLADAYNIYKNKGLYSVGEKYAEPSVRRALQAKEYIASLPISDVNKHQYLSCIGSTDGLLATAETLGGGMYKEGQDTKDKLINPHKRPTYGGVFGVLEDAWKDMKNDVTGSATGYISGKQGMPWLCELLRYFPINPKW